jgi:hypothetical protein
MAELYAKRGRSVRYENGAIVRAFESGEAVEDGPRFRCHPVRAPQLPDLDPDAVRETSARIRSRVSHPLSIERLVVSEGISEHRFGDRTWSERHRRVHLSLARAPFRVLIDLGDFDLAPVEEAARAFAAAGPERDAPPRIRLAPPVAAALLPALVGVAPPNVHLVQSAGGRDGKGNAIEEHDAHEQPWPNWYRPSYRVPPVRAPLNLRARCAVTHVDENLPRAVALLAPVDRLTLRVLLDDRGRVHPATVHVARIDAIAQEVVWFPYGAGSFGAEMVL